jgi:hypothetical protein
MPEQFDRHRVLTMKQEETENPSRDEKTETPTAEMFRSRPEIAARLSAEDKELLLAIATDYEELARILTAPKSDPA